MHGLLEYPDGGIESMVRTVLEGILNLNLVDHVPLGTTGEGNQKGDLVTRITVTSSILALARDFS